MDALGVELGVQHLAERAVDDGVGFLRIGEQERKVEDLEILDHVARMPELSDTIASVPPCSAETFGASPPSTPPGKSLTLILPPLLAATSSANFSMPDDERVALRVLQSRT